MVLGCMGPTEDIDSLEQAFRIVESEYEAADSRIAAGLDLDMAAGHAGSRRLLADHSFDSEVDTAIENRSTGALLAERRSPAVAVDIRILVAAVGSLDLGRRTMALESRSLQLERANRTGCGRIGCRGQTL